MSIRVGIILLLQVVLLKILLYISSGACLLIHAHAYTYIRTYLEEEFLDCRMCENLALQDNIELFLKTLVSIYTTTNNS